jgi:hypothetical protein
LAVVCGSVQRSLEIGTVTEEVHSILEQALLHAAQPRPAPHRAVARQSNQRIRSVALGMCRCRFAAEHDGREAAQTKRAIDRLERRKLVLERLLEIDAESIVLFTPKELDEQVMRTQSAAAPPGGWCGHQCSAQIYAAAGQIENCDCAAVNKLENFLDAALASGLESERGRADSQMTPTDGLGQLLSREPSLMVGAQSPAGTARSLRRNAAVRAVVRALVHHTYPVRENVGTTS